MRNLISNVAVILLLLITGNIYAQVPDLNDKIPIDPGVRSGKLKNGFTYYLQNTSEPDQKTRIRFVVKAGYVHEAPDQLGLAHVLEHMAFRNTVHFPNSSMRKYLTKVGLTRNDWNALTQQEATSYFISLPDDKSVPIDSLLIIVEDWAQGIVLDSVQVESERMVVYNEIAGTYNPTDIESQIRFKQLKKHKYDILHRAQELDNLRNFELSSLTKFYEAWYTPERQALIITGKFDIDELEEKIRVKFERLKNSNQVRNGFEQSYAVNLIGSNQFIALENPKSLKTSFELFVKKEAGTQSVETNRDLLKSLKDEIFNQLINARLIRLKNEQGIVEPWAFGQIKRNAINQLAKIDAFRLSINPTEANKLLDETEMIFEELERIKRYGFSESELETAKAIVNEQHKPDAGYSSDALALRYEAHFVNNTAAPDAAYRSKLVADLLKSVSLKDIKVMTKFWLNVDRNRDAILRRAPNESISFNERDFEACLKRVSTKKISKPELNKYEPITTLMRKGTEPKILPLSKVMEYEELAVTKLILDNGITVLLKPTLAGNISLSGYKPLGLNAYPESSHARIKPYSYLNELSPIDKIDAFQLKNYLKENGITLNLELKDSVSVINASCNAEQMEPLLQYIFLRLTRIPKVGSADFEKFARAVKSNADYAKSSEAYSGYGPFINFVVNKSYGRNLNAEVNLSSQFEQPDINEAVEVYTNRFVNEGGWTFVISGNFQMEDAKTLAAQYLGNLSSQLPGKPTVDKRPPQLVLQPEHHKFVYGNRQVAVAYLYFPTKIELKATTTLELDVLSRILSEKITNRLREKEGGAYRHSASGTLYKDQSACSFYIYFECLPERAEDLVKAAVEEFKGLGDFSEESYKAAVDIVANNNPAYNLESGAFWKNYLVEKYSSNGDMMEVLKRKTILQDIFKYPAFKEIAKKYINTDYFQQFVWLPENP